MGNHSVECDDCGADLRGLSGGCEPYCPSRNGGRRQTPEPAKIDPLPTGAQTADITAISAAVEGMISRMVEERMKEVTKTFEDLMLAIAFADPNTLIDTVWMPESIAKNVTIYDFLALERQRLCAPVSGDAELVPCHDPNCDRHGTPHFLEDSCEG
ncbi:MAG: hypothetical protein ABJN42_21660 [Roseibium sp.]|uniref:hypothetical protein n=1 Tax=Roseibium sp. TaxID=1936156 RepID=UPI003298B144